MKKHLHNDDDDWKPPSRDGAKKKSSSVDGPTRRSNGLDEARKRSASLDDAKKRTSNVLNDTPKRSISLDEAKKRLANVAEPKKKSTTTDEVRKSASLDVPAKKTSSADAVKKSRSIDVTPKKAPSHDGVRRRPPGQAKSDDATKGPSSDSDKRRGRRSGESMAYAGAAKIWASTLSEDSVRSEWESLQSELTPPVTELEPSIRSLCRYETPCFEETRVRLKAGPADFIHANRVNGEAERRWIITQGPLADTIGHFWQMVWEEKAPAIIMLCNWKEQGQDKCAEYFKGVKGEKMKVQLGNGKELTVTTELSGPLAECKGTDQLIIHSVLRLKCAGQVQHVNHLHYKTWPDKSVPATTRAILPLLGRLDEILRDLVKAKRTTRDRPVVVHCSAGVGRSGTLVAAHTLHRQLLATRSEGPPSLPGILRSLRRQRANLVQTPGQYAFVYNVTLAYLARRRLLPPTAPAVLPTV